MVLDLVSQVCDLALLDHARGALDCVGEPQEARDHVRCRVLAIELDDAFAELLKQIASFDAEVLEGIGRHYTLAWGCITRASSLDRLVSCADVSRVWVELVSVSLAA